MGAAEGTAARPEGTARGSERRGLRPGCSAAGRVRRAETLAACPRRGHQRWLLPRPPPQPRRSGSATRGRIYGRAPRRGGSGRGGSGGAAGRVGGRGGGGGAVSRGAAAARALGCEQGYISPVCFFPFSAARPAAALGRAAAPMAEGAGCRRPLARGDSGAPRYPRTHRCELLPHREQAPSPRTGLNAAPQPQG